MATTIDTSGVTASTSSSAGSSASSSRTTLGRDDFYKIMIGELSNQNPFEPLDNQQFLGQLTSLQSMDTMTRLTDGIASLVLGQRLGAASALIGREVRAASSGSETGVTGTVEKVQVKDGEVSLVLDGDRTVKIEDLAEIQ
jgi:flagellar basal-body rod modification protein FlgD